MLNDFLKETKKSAYYTNNYIVYDYEGVDLVVIESILRYHLKELKTELQKLKDTHC